MRAGTNATNARPGRHSFRARAKAAHPSIFSRNSSPRAYLTSQSDSRILDLEYDVCLYYLLPATYPDSTERIFPSFELAFGLKVRKCPFILFLTGAKPDILLTRRSVSTVHTEYRCVRRQMPVPVSCPSPIQRFHGLSLRARTLQSSYFGSPGS